MALMGVGLAGLRLVQDSVGDNRRSAESPTFQRTRPHFAVDRRAQGDIGKPNENFIFPPIGPGLRVAQTAVMSHAASSGPEPTRRDLLSLVATSGAIIGVGAIAWPLVDSINPSADVIAAGAPIDIDISKLALGQQIVVLWRGAPMLIVNRTPEALKTLQDPTLISHLSDPNSTVHQQPPYAENWHRSVKPEVAVLVGICTHLGCLPGYLPNPDPTTPGGRLARRVFLSMSSIKVQIWRAGSTRVCPPRTTCPFLPILLSTTRPCASAKIRQAGLSS